EEQDALLAERRVDDLERRGQAGEHDAGRALEVVVVTEDLLLVAVEEPDGVRPLPVLEVDAAAGEHLLYGLNELVHELVQPVLGRWRLAQAEVKGVGAERGVGRADIEEHRQEAAGRHGGAGGVELELADRDAHAVGPDVTEAEDAPARRDADEANVP